MRLNINTGDKFNKLTVINELKSERIPCGQINRFFLTQCECGSFKKVRLLHLVRGRIKSCGCIQPERHGFSHSKIYNTWRGMRTRCNNPLVQKHLYKDRGISVCENWQKSFIDFKTWALRNGFKEGLQIDRINNDLGYSPDNCRFVTPYQNSINKRNTKVVTYNGKCIPLVEILRMKNLKHKYSCVGARIRRGWDVKKAIDTPIFTNKKNRKKMVESEH
jgi:hypothetical protein